MNLKNRKLLRTGVLIILYLLHAQAFLTGKIREELRTELGLMNLILVPLCVIINLYFVVVMLSNLKNKSMEKSDMFYLILSLLLYGLMGYNMAA